MKQLTLINRQKMVVGSITWTAPDQLDVDITDTKLAAGVNILLTEARNNGLVLRGGERLEREGNAVFIDKQETIKISDERFLRALADHISQVNFNGQRVFGLLQAEEKSHAGV